MREPDVKQTPDGLMIVDDPVNDEEDYPNQSFKTHKKSRVKNKYRNIPCPCGSGKKLKKCCIGKID